MDEKLAKALEFANYKHTLFLEKRRLQEKLKINLTYPYNGGNFFIDKSFIACLYAFKSQPKNSSVILLDEKLWPIEIKDLDDFIANVLETYNRATQSYLEEFNKLKNARSVKILVNLDE